MSILSCVEVEPKQKAKASVIWLHGLGADGNDFAPIVPELRLPEDLPIRFIFPHAPSIPVTINGGMEMPAWYDILAIDLDREINHEQIIASSNAVCELIEREISRGVESERIIIAGFSQGGAVAYEAALSFGQTLAGLICMSTYFATHETIKLNPANKNIPIQIYHGTADPMVAEELGKRAHNFLAEKGYAVAYESYPMEHNVCAQQVQHISSWLQQCFDG